MIYNFNTDFNQDTLDKFIDFVNSSGDSPIDVYINSNGGSTWCSQVMLDIIESSPEKFTLTAYGQLGSSAFSLFFKASCERKILPTCIGVYHQAKMRIDVNFSSKPYGKDDEAFVNALREDFDNDLVFVKSLKFSEHELSRYLEGQDVFFQYDRLKSFLDVSDSQKLKLKSQN